ncbi:hypothetical protein D3C85_1699090 [compost metagenome]
MTMQTGYQSLRDLVGANLVTASGVGDLCCHKQRPAAHHLAVKATGPQPQPGGVYGGRSLCHLAHRFVIPMAWMGGYLAHGAPQQRLNAGKQSCFDVSNHQINPRER